MALSAKGETGPYCMRLKYLEKIAQTRHTIDKTHTKSESDT